MPTSLFRRWMDRRFDLYAPIYDLFVQRLDAARRRGLARVPWPERPRVLLVGGGTGLDLPYLPPDADVTLVDLSPAMRVRAEARARRLGRPVAVQEGDALALPFSDGTFDVVLLHFLLAVVPDPRQALREAVRVVRPGGFVSIVDKLQPDDRPPSLLRRAAEVVAFPLATSLVVQIGPLVKQVPVEVAYNVPVLLGGFFRAVGLRRNG